MHFLVKNAHFLTCDRMIKLANSRCVVLPTGNEKKWLKKRRRNFSLRLKKILLKQELYTN